MRRAATRCTAAASAALLLVTAGCTDTRTGSSEEVVVFAAASLSQAFMRIGNSVENEHPGLQVRFSFAGSSSLAPQISAGAQADVFASANTDTMQLVIDRGDVVEQPSLIARNQLEIAVPEGNPAGIESLEDLNDPDVTLALCAPEVPCGSAAQRVLRGKVSVQPETFEEDVKAVLNRVELGEVDAGLVYHTDVLAARDAVTGIEFDESDLAVNDYLIAPIANGSSPEGAEAFIEFVRSMRGREILRDAGFDVP
jgi:molybdate transport system substrate-binding protein